MPTPIFEAAPQARFEILTSILRSSRLQANALPLAHPNYKLSIAHANHAYT